MTATEAQHKISVLRYNEGLREEWDRFVDESRNGTFLHKRDYMEYHAKMMKKEGNKAVIQVRSYKIIEVPENPPYPSSIDVLPDPPLSTIVEYVYETY